MDGSLRSAPRTYSGRTGRGLRCPGAGWKSRSASSAARELLLALLWLYLGFCPGVPAAANTSPTIEPIPDQTVLIDHPTVARQLALADLETPVPGLHLTGSSSDQSVVPDTNIFFGLALGHWYLTVTPIFGVTGATTITVQVDDGEAGATTSFLMTVTPPPPGTERFVNSGPITIPQAGAADPYPSIINVTGLAGTITNLSLTLSKFSHENARDVNVLLVSPSGVGVVVLSHISGDRAATNVTVYLTDASAYSLPLDFPLWSEPLRPTDYASADLFPGAPPGPYGPTAFATFRGQPANGAWSLYVYDDTGTNAGSIAAGWSLLIGAVPGPSLSPIPDQFTASGVPLIGIPFRVNDPSVALDSLQITASSSNPTLLPGENIVLGGSDTNRGLSLFPVVGETGSATITLRVNDGQATADTSFFLTVTQANPALRVFSNGSSILIPEFGSANPYPSTIFVDGLAGQLTNVSVVLRDLSHTYPADVDILLVGPQGQEVVIFSDAGRGDHRISGVTVELSDEAPAALPEFGPILSGTFKPTNYEPGETGELDSFPGAPEGPASPTLSVFNGLSPNGVWSLYVVDDGPGDQGSIAGGWSLRIATSFQPGDLVLSRLERMDDGSIKVRGNGDAGGNYSIEGSEDLLRWENLGTVTADEVGAFEFLDGSAALHNTQFYRVEKLNSSGG